MKILFLVRDQLKVGKEDLRSHHLFVTEFEKHHDVVWWGPLRDNYDQSIPMPDLVAKYKPDIIYKYGFRMPFEIGLEDVKIPKILYLVDYFPPKGDYPGVKKPYVNFMLKSKFDTVFVPVSYMVRHVLETGICNHAILSPFGVNASEFKKHGVHKDIDVLALYTVRNDVYPHRLDVIKTIINMKNVNFFHGKTSIRAYVGAVNRAKIFVTSNNIFGSLSMKYTEVMACGTFMLADEPEDLNLLGFEDGKHLVI